MKHRKHQYRYAENLTCLCGKSFRSREELLFHKRTCKFLKGIGGLKEKPNGDTN